MMVKHSPTCLGWVPIVGCPPGCRGIKEDDLISREAVLRELMLLSERVVSNSGVMKALAVELFLEARKVVWSIPEAHVDKKDSWARRILPEPPHRKHWKVKPLVAWYDLWVGIFIDRKGRKLYILPLPMLGVMVEWP